jgi:hypothetical protein
MLAFPLGPNKRFDKYQAIETYEIRPGILITPTYTAQHEICEVAIEKRHYSNNVVDMDAELSDEQIQELFEELVPKSERGQLAWNLGEGTERTDTDGGVSVTYVPYKNVTFAKYRKAKHQNYLAAIITWKTPRCDRK